MFTGTFRRNNEGDYRCPEEVIRRMVAEQIEDARDGRVLQHFGMEDLDPTTIAGYRRRYNTQLHEHLWVKLDDREFIRRVGAFGTDRATGKEGLTAGGLLMFGKMVSIKDAFPMRRARGGTVSAIADGRCLVGDEERVLVYMRKHGSITNSECQPLLGKKKRWITYLLKGMVGKGLLRRDGERRWARYRQP